jgi:uncharacterized DUF497 family protein
MPFEWDEEKNRTNRRKHDVSFETAALVFDDPYALTKRDMAHDEEERFITLGAIGPGSILFVVHANYESAEKAEVIRVISARAATSRERKSYEEAHKGTEARNRGCRSKERRTH